MDLSVKLGPLRLANPLLTASGCYGYGTEFGDLCPPGLFGAVVVKGTTPEPRSGNPPPRLAEVAGGLLNAIGLENPGLDGFLKLHLPRLRRYQVPVIVNIAGHRVEDYREMAARLDQVEGVDALEVNISCPNVRQGGMAFGVDPASTAAVVRAVRRVTTKPLLVKLTPNVADPVPIARAAVDEGADVLSMINTLVGMRIDVERRRPVLGNITGGLSGPAIRPVAVRMIWQVYRAVPAPIVGMGGVTSAEDALEFFLAGASAVALGTVLLRDPGAPVQVLDGIREYLVRHRFRSVGELVGLAHRNAGGGGT